MILGDRNSAASSFVRTHNTGMVLEVPDVFPASDASHDLTDFHDIIRGYVPGPISSRHGGADGWLRLALETGSLPAYTDPILPKDQQTALNDSYRQALNAEINVERSWVIDRKAIDLSRLVNKVHYDHVGLYRGISQQPAERPIESALAFMGTVTLFEDSKARRQKVQGIHFRSGQLRGWARIFGW